MSRSRPRKRTGTGQSADEEVPVAAVAPVVRLAEPVLVPMAGGALGEPVAVAVRGAVGAVGARGTVGARGAVGVLVSAAAGAPGTVGGRVEGRADDAIGAGPSDALAEVACGWALHAIAVSAASVARATGPLDRGVRWHVVMTAS